MKLKSLFAAALLGSVAVGAFADDQTVFLGPAPSGALFGSLPGTVFASLGGFDTISFAGLTPGTYTVDVELSGQGVSFNEALSNLSSTLGHLVGNALHFSVTHTGSENPFVLQLYGSDTNGAGVSFYNGSVTVAVPEPETYALFLAGLAAMGYVARRRRPQD